MINLNHNTVNRRPIIDQFGPHHVSTADEERMSEMEQVFPLPLEGQQCKVGNKPSQNPAKSLETTQKNEVK